MRKFQMARWHVAHGFPDVTLFLNYTHHAAYLPGVANPNGFYGDVSIWNSDGTVAKSIPYRIERPTNADTGFWNYSPGALCEVNGKTAFRVANIIYSWPDGKQLGEIDVPYPATATGSRAYREYTKWRDDVIGKYDVNTSHQRCLTSDSHVVMTGSEAKGMAATLFGPTRAAEILNVKGLSQNHIVIWQRGGAIRVMKIDRKDNPIHLVWGPGGLTVLAVCSHSAYEIDLDV